MVVYGGFVMSDFIGVNGGIPIVDEGKVGLEEGVGSREVELWIDGQCMWVVCFRQ